MANKKREFNVSCEMGRLLFDLLNILFVTFFSPIKGQKKTINLCLRGSDDLQFIRV